jgi:hypothetical protein
MTITAMERNNNFFMGNLYLLRLNRVSCVFSRIAGDSPPHYIEGWGELLSFPVTFTVA